MKRNGFTLIEVLVSVALFSTVMVVALGSLIALSSAVHRAEALDTAINNLSAALDSMSRAIRTGTTYHCGGGVFSTPTDCYPLSAAAPSFTFLDADGNQVTYCLSDGSPGSTTCGTTTSCPTISPNNSCTILRSKGGGSFVPLTAAEVNVSSLKFVVDGSLPGPSDKVQPRVIMLLVSTITIGPNSTSQFQLQTSVTQRIYDQ